MRLARTASSKRGAIHFNPHPHSIVFFEICASRDRVETLYASPLGHRFHIYSAIASFARPKMSRDGHDMIRKVALGTIRICIWCRQTAILCFFLLDVVVKRLGGACRGYCSDAIVAHGMWWFFIPPLSLTPTPLQTF